MWCPDQQAAAKNTWDLLKMKILKLYPNPLKQQEWVLSQLWFNKPSNRFKRTAKV